MLSSCVQNLKPVLPISPSDSSVEVIRRRSEDASIILDIPTVDLDVTDNNGFHVEDVARYPDLYLDESV